MPVLTINGRQVTVDDSFLNLPREEQDSTVEEIASSIPKPAPSGVVAGMNHGATEPYNGAAETLKRFAGVGPGRKDDPNYVPANVTNGSWNPANWSPSQLPQKIAEMAPSMVPDVASGAAGAALGRKIGGVKGAAIGGLIGAMLSGTARTAGDTDKEATVARTGDANAPSSTADLVRGGGTALAASAAGALLPTRFVPGLNTVAKDAVGPSGALNAVTRALATTAAGGVGAVGSNAATQAGLSVGTDKGLSVDPSQFPEAAVGGAATGATLGVPRLATDAIRSGTLAKFGGDNLLPTKNVATRLQAASENLGNAKSDENALGTVMSDLRNELGDASAKVRKQLPNLSPEVDNALVRAQRGDKITPDEVRLIKNETAAAPDGANAAFLAHSVHVADLMSERGGHSDRGWSGGLSGVMDKNLGFLLNPARLAGGAAATALGMHLLGTSNPMFGASLAGTYGATRVLDSATGMRSPAKTFAEHFADQSAQLRMPTTPSAPAPNQGPAPSAPWGPRPPMAGPTGPTVSPPAAPPTNAPPGPWGPRPPQANAVPQVAPPGAPPAPAPDLNPIAMSMLKQRLKTGLPPEPTQAPTPDAPPDVNPLMLPRDITTPAKNLMAGFKNTGKMENTYNTETRKAEGVAQAEALAANSSTINDQGGLAALSNPAFKKRGSELLGAASVMQRLTGESPGEVAAAKQEQAQARAEAKTATAVERSQAKAERATVVANAAAAKAEQAKTKAAAQVELAKAKEAAKLEQTKVKLATAQLKATTIKKSNGKVQVDAPQAPKAKPFEPYDESGMFYPKGVTAKEYAAQEKARYGASSPRYEKSAERSAQKRINATSELSAAFPQYRRSFEGLLRHLHEIGNHPEEISGAVEHYASHVPDDVGNAIREAFH